VHFQKPKLIQNIELITSQNHHIKIPVKRPKGVYLTGIDETDFSTFFPASIIQNPVWAIQADRLRRISGNQKSPHIRCIFPDQCGNVLPPHKWRLPDTPQSMSRKIYNLLGSCNS